MLQEYEHHSHCGTIDFIKTPGGTISLHASGRKSSRHINDHHNTPTELLQRSIDVFLKDDAALRHKTTPAIEVLATRFTDFLRDMPSGPNRVRCHEFRAWLAIQLDELNNPAPINPPVDIYPVSKISKLKSLSLRDSNNEVSFHQAGFICYKEASSIPPLFNIEQMLWPYRQVSMDWINTSEASCVLAANILLAYSINQKNDSAESPIKTPSLSICAAFAEFFIEPMPYQGGHIPLQGIAWWLKENVTL